MSDGASVLVRGLKAQGVDTVFGIVGAPVIEVGLACAKQGVKFVACRNEQAASYAAGVFGFLTKKPGVCLVVSGPGVVHALAGLANAQQNCFPMIVIGGASDRVFNSRGAFQECPQVQYAQPYCKYAAQIDSLERIPFYIEKACREACYGRPGACYLDLPGELVTKKVDENSIVYPAKWLSPPICLADPLQIEKAVDGLKGASNPLVIIGKGAAYANASDELRELIELTNCPFLPTPMGKGVISDVHENSCAPARSLALQTADVIVLCGARLNWILHFGLPPRFHKSVKIIQLDVAHEAFGNNVPAYASLCGDMKHVLRQLNQEVRKQAIAKLDRSTSTWWRSLDEQIEKNTVMSKQLIADTSRPLMNYYQCFEQVQKVLCRDPQAIQVVEGANTMDISRSILKNYFPKTRLDAGTYGTMGIGSGFAIAAAVVNPDKPIWCIQGDSAFGFGGMEIETACRYRLKNINWIIVNNSGITLGRTIKGNTAEERMLGGAPVTSLGPEAHYERMIEAFDGGKGFFVDRADQIVETLEKALAHDGPTITNIIIDPRATRKPQKFEWLTRAKI